MNFQRLLDEPISLIFVILLVIQMTFMLAKTLLDTYKSKKSIEKIKKELSESEKRVQEILGIMDTNKAELLNSLESLNNDLKTDLDKLKQFQDGPQTPTE